MRIGVKQRDISDCGPACIASIAAYYKLSCSVSRIRQLAATDCNGTTVQGMLEALRELGFQARGAKGPIESLLGISAPAIVHVILEKEVHHYLVIYQIMKDKVLIMDPKDGQTRRLTIKDFNKIWTGIVILVRPENLSTSESSTFTFRYFWKLVYSQKKSLLIIILGAIGYTLLGLGTSIYIGHLVDHVLAGKQSESLNILSIVVLFVIGFQVTIGWVKNFITIRTGQSLDQKLILGYFSHLIRLPQSFFDSMRIGELISRMNDAVKIRILLSEVSTSILVNFLILLFSFGLMFTLYWRLAIVATLIVPVYSTIYWIINSVNKIVERQLIQNSAQLESQLIESISTIRTIKCHGLESNVGNITTLKFGKVLDSAFQSNLNTLWSSSSTELASKILTILILWIGSGFVLCSKITTGQLLSFYALLAYFTGPAFNLIATNKYIQNAKISGERLFEIMIMQAESLEGAVPPSQIFRDDIEITCLKFGYNKWNQLFIDLSLQIKAGELTAFVGPSGSGKSTLAYLLMKIYQPQSGSISIGGHTLETISARTLRNEIAIVPQKIDLISGSLTDNIALGLNEPNHDRIRNLCSELGILDFIETLPGQFATPIGENGLALSGGQRQVIAIARALYRNPSILILDESTSSLDSASESYVKKVLTRLRNDKTTVILISHRLSSVVMADKIIVLAQGKVHEQGTHEELLARGEAYFQLWREQFPGGFDLTPGPSPRERGAGSAFIAEDHIFTTDHKTWQLRKEQARNLRKNQTKAEEILWQEIRNSKLGERFRRQHAIGSFIVDFVCLRKKLIIEVDGPIHDRQKEADEKRTRILNTEGFRVVRFRNEEVMNNLSTVLSSIKYQMSLPSPLERGRG